LDRFNHLFCNIRQQFCNCGGYSQYLIPANNCKLLLDAIEFYGAVTSQIIVGAEPDNPGQQQPVDESLPVPIGVPLKQKVRNICFILEKKGMITRNDIKGRRLLACKTGAGPVSDNKLGKLLCGNGEIPVRDLAIEW